MSHKTFSIVLVVVALTYLGVIALINIIVDPFNIFRTPFFKEQAQINDRYAKIAFLKKRGAQFNSYLMGSSRMFFTAPEMIERYIPSAKFYNLATIFGTMYEHLLHVKYLLDRGFPLQNLYIGLDMDMYAVAKLHDGKDCLLRLHPDVQKENPTAFYWSYLSQFPRKDIQRKLRVNFKKRAVSKYQIEKDGTVVMRSTDENARIFFERPLGAEKIQMNNEKMRENLRALEELVDLCGKHRINLILFITPYHKDLIDRFVEEEYIAVLKDLSSIAPYWDFSGYNSVTTDNKNYLDHSHYKPSVSRLIAARIFSDRTSDLPQDFGVWVTKENIASHLKNVKSLLQERRQNEGKSFPR